MSSLVILCDLFPLCPTRPAAAPWNWYGLTSGSTSNLQAACDYRSLWITSVAFADDNHFIATDNDGNLRSWRVSCDISLSFRACANHRSAALTHSTRMTGYDSSHYRNSISARLSTSYATVCVACVTSLTNAGSLAMRDGERKDSMLLGAVSGAIYVIVALSKLEFEFLSQVRHSIFPFIAFYLVCCFRDCTLLDSLSLSHKLNRFKLDCCNTFAALVVCRMLLTELPAAEPILSASRLASAASMAISSSACWSCRLRSWLRCEPQLITLCRLKFCHSVNDNLLASNC
jgi:hypothetical protein